MDHGEGAKAKGFLRTGPWVSHFSQKQWLGSLGQHETSMCQKAKASSMYFRTHCHKCVITKKEVGTEKQMDCALFSYKSSSKKGESPKRNPKSPGREK